MPESGTYGSVRGALSNGRPYRDRVGVVLPTCCGEVERSDQRSAAPVNKLTVPCPDVRRHGHVTLAGAASTAFSRPDLNKLTVPVHGLLRKEA